MSSYTNKHSDFGECSVCHETFEPTKPGDIVSQRTIWETHLLEHESESKSETQYVLKQRKHRTEDDKAREAFNRGMWLYGYCNGIFGSDSFEDKQIVEVIGNYIEVKNEEGITRTAIIDEGGWIQLLEASNQEYAMKEKYESRKD